MKIPRVSRGVSLVSIYVDLNPAGRSTSAQSGFVALCVPTLNDAIVMDDLDIFTIVRGSFNRQEKGYTPLAYPEL